MVNYFESPVTIAGLRQYARAVQRSLLSSSSGDRSLVIDNVQKESDSMNCLEYIMGLSSMGEAIGKLKVETLNTRERSLANMRVESYLGGHVFPGALSTTYKTFCEFNPDAVGGQ